MLLVRVRMFDAGVDHPQEDVCCDIRPDDARELAFSLLASAEHAEQITRQASWWRHHPARSDTSHDEHQARRTNTNPTTLG